MNFIITLVRDNLHLTRKAIASFRKQDIEGGVEIVVVDNGSTDGTAAWLQGQRDLITMTYRPQLGVAAGWNAALRFVFGAGALVEDYALVVNNDVELRPDTYRLLVENGGGFVTAVGVRDVKDMLTSDPTATRPHPDFSCFLIHRSVYEKVGAFDEGFEGAFCEDGDYDLRLYKAGIRAYCIDLPFLHHGSMTVKNADHAEMRRIQRQADRNRKFFIQKWGFGMGSEAYYAALDKGGPPEVSASEGSLG